MVQAIHPRPTRGRRRRGAGITPAPHIPIVDGTHAVVGWTENAPEIESGRLRHAAAERLLGGPIFCTQVALIRPDEVARAGGPANWPGPWRCLALCPIEHARGLEQPLARPAAEPASRSERAIPPLAPRVASDATRDRPAPAG